MNVTRNHKIITIQAIDKRETTVLIIILLFLAGSVSAWQGHRDKLTRDYQT
jgi:hypothetical protein